MTIYDQRMNQKTLSNSLLPWLKFKPSQHFEIYMFYIENGLSQHEFWCFETNNYHDHNWYLEHAKLELSIVITWQRPLITVLSSKYIPKGIEKFCGGRVHSCVHAKWVNLPTLGKIFEGFACLIWQRSNLIIQFNFGDILKLLLILWIYWKVSLYLSSVLPAAGKKFQGLASIIRQRSNHTKEFSSGNS